jgi:serine/threonine-protein kinase RsbT
MEEIKIEIKDELDIFIVQNAGKKFSKEIGFSKQEIETIAIVVSELSSNIVKYAKKGEISFCPLQKGGIEIVAQDQGPGIKNINLALQDGCSDEKSIIFDTKHHGLGSGLPAVKRLTDEMEIETTKGKGTTICVRKWKSKYR